MIRWGPRYQKLKKSRFFAINPRLRKITWLFWIFENYRHTQNSILHLLSPKRKGVRSLISEIIGNFQKLQKFHFVKHQKIRPQSTTLKIIFQFFRPKNHLHLQCNFRWKIIIHSRVIVKVLFLEHHDFDSQWWSKPENMGGFRTAILCWCQIMWQKVIFTDKNDFWG